MYQVIIFDLDGTLIDSSEGIIHAAEKTIEILGYPSMSRDEIRSYIGPPVGKGIIERNGFDEKELNHFNSVFRDLYKNKYLMEASVYPGVYNMLSSLKDRFVCIATNKREDYTKMLLDNFKISELCDCVRGLDMKGELKKRNLIEDCIKASNNSVQNNIVMVGDTDNDLFAAKECNIDFIGVTYGFGFKNESDVKYGRAVKSVQSLLDVLL